VKLPLTLLLALALAPALAGDDPRLAESRELATRFQIALGGRLKSVIAREGAVAAIEICRREAPAIAAAMSVNSGKQLRRIALRTRNPANAADAAERELLQRFAAQMRADPQAVPEHFAAAEDGSARYLRAIVTQPLCLVCHGPAPAAEVRAEIARYYPDDHATGFAAGELRGALVVEWPAPAQDPRP